MNNHAVEIQGIVTQSLTPSLKRVYYLSIRGVGVIRISKAHVMRLMIMSDAKKEGII